jgi:hypothetical protein
MSSVSVQDDFLAMQNGELPRASVRTDASHSILKQVASSRRQNRRRRIPAWALKLITLRDRLHRFLTVAVPQIIRERRSEMLTAAVSFLVHLAIGLMLALWLLPIKTETDLIRLLAAPEDVIANEALQEVVEVVQPELIHDRNTDSTVQQMLSELNKDQDRFDVFVTDDINLTLPLEDLTDVPDVPVLNGTFSGRSAAGRRAAVASNGGSAESERAVLLGLKWLKSIQRSDGSWCFAEIGESDQPGRLTTTDMGATAMALLCYLGAGYTHDVESPFQQTVRSGLAYLVNHAEHTSSGMDLRGQFQANSGLYVQGIATICLCEASAMVPTDKDLKRLATDAIRFLERSQDRTEGGWRYWPGERGDLSVTGWQLMALHSAKSGRIKVQSDSLRDAKEFLNSVELENGAFYSYMPRGPRTDSMTAVGLLCRMYNGWRRDRPALIQGVEYLATVGPQPGSIYYNYYATQVLHHWGGELWTNWNLRMREELVQSQRQDGPAAGSWDYVDSSDHGLGGRLYQTTLSILTLEVYYRHLPLYRRFDETAVTESSESTN